MSLCYEVAIFKVEQQNMARVIELSLKIFNEINAEQPAITSYDILKKTGVEDELCWQLTWVNEAAVKTTTAKWPTFPSTKALESLVGEKVYYGHFLSLI
jgi:quinol monooxygenase YgiN